jgi:hypothetical protein
MPRCRREAGWPEVCKRLGRNWVVRSRGGPDAGFANPKVYELLEAERFKYAIRLRQTGGSDICSNGQSGFIVTAPLPQMFQRPWARESAQGRVSPADPSIGARLVA